MKGSADRAASEGGAPPSEDGINSPVRPALVPAAQVAQVPAKPVRASKGKAKGVSSAPPVTTNLRATSADETKSAEHDAKKVIAGVITFNADDADKVVQDFASSTSLQEFWDKYCGDDKLLAKTSKSWQQRKSRAEKNSAPEIVQRLAKESNCLKFLMEMTRALKHHQARQKLQEFATQFMAESPKSMPWWAMEIFIIDRVDKAIAPWEDQEMKEEEFVVTAVSALNLGEVQAHCWTKMDEDTWNKSLATLMSDLWLNVLRCIAVGRRAKTKTLKEVVDFMRLFLSEAAACMKDEGSVAPESIECAQNIMTLCKYDDSIMDSDALEAALAFLNDSVTEMAVWLRASDVGGSIMKFASHKIQVNKSKVALAGQINSFGDQLLKMEGDWTPENAEALCAAYAALLKSVHACLMDWHGTSVDSALHLHKLFGAMASFLKKVEEVCLSPLFDAAMSFLANCTLGDIPAADPEALTVYLRAAHPYTNALQVIVEASPEPFSHEFRLAHLKI